MQVPRISQHIHYKIILKLVRITDPKKKPKKPKKPKKRKKNQNLQFLVPALFMCSCTSNTKRQHLTDIALGTTETSAD